MISSQRLLKMARKWQKFAINARKRIATSRSGRSAEAELCTKSVSEKGHFSVYTIDGRRFMLPLAFLSGSIFIELLRMSEEQFGLPCDGLITLPCEDAFMEHVVSFFESRRASKDGEKALLSSIATGRCSTPSMAHQGQTQQQIIVHGF